MLAARFTDGDELKLLAGIQQARLLVAVKAGDFVEMRRLLEDERANESIVSFVFKTLVHCILTFRICFQDCTGLLNHAVRLGDLSAVEYLVDRGADMNASTNASEHSCAAKAD